jgi:hypothetical protein
VGEFVNTRFENFVNWTIVAVIVIMSTLLGISTMFPSLFAGRA